MAGIIERLIDEAAAKLGIDRIQLRRRNLIPNTPWTTATGVRYDSGNFPAVLQRAVAESDWAGFATRRQASRARGRLRGIGLACFIEATGGPNKEHAALRFTDTGDFEIHSGTQSQGQGHETVLPQLLAHALGISEERIHLVQGDHAVGAESGGTIASRTLVAAGGAVKVASALFLEKAKAAAARELEASSADLEYGAGLFRVSGTDRVVSLTDLIKNHALEVNAAFDVPTTYPNGCHVAEVEIDPETGHAALVRYTAVDDFGQVQHEAIVEGQVHGGVAQGAGQALCEHCRYDGASGQLVTGSYMDYAVPRAEDLPSIAAYTVETKALGHPLGAKGAGESGATAAPGAVMNAIADALRAVKAGQVDMPATPARVWQAIRNGGASMGPQR
jgi:carbon-monoxide dehydrogenase large subunit